MNYELWIRFQEIIHLKKLTTFCSLLIIISCSLNPIYRIFHFYMQTEKLTRWQLSTDPIQVRVGLTHNRAQGNPHYINYEVASLIKL